MQSILARRTFHQSSRRLFGFGSVNKVTLVGNVGKVPEIRDLGDDRKAAVFPLATTESFKTKEGQQQNVTMWHRINVYGKNAEMVERFVGVGARVYVEGKLRYNEYEKDGKMMKSTDIMVANNGNIVVLSPAKKTEQEEEVVESSRGR